jgi:O-acetyl-ADP-ribose deacetylase (regulator of RNase III)
VSVNTDHRRRGALTFVAGDATRPVGDGARVLAHVCNDAGRWGKGFVVPVGRRWPHVRQAFLAWHHGAAAGEPPFELGQVQVVEAEAGLWVANMLGQHGVLPRDGVPPIRYDALRQALGRVAIVARDHGASVHIPRIGCGLAGGSWNVVGPMVGQTLCEAGVDVTVYDLPEARKVDGAT